MLRRPRHFRSASRRPIAATRPTTRRWWPAGPATRMCGSISARPTSNDPMLAVSLDAGSLGAMLLDLVENCRGISGAAAILKERGQGPVRDAAEVLVALTIQQPGHAEERQQDNQPDGRGQHRHLKEGHSPDQGLGSAHDADNR